MIEVATPGSRTPRTSMNVLVLHSELGVLWGGGETFTTSLFEAFVRRGHRVSAAFVADRQGAYPRTLPPSFDAMPIRGWWSRKPGQAVLSSIGTRLPNVVTPAWSRLQEGVCWRTVRWHNHRFQRRVESTFAGRWDGFDAVYVNGNIGLAQSAALHRPTMLMLPGPVSEEATPSLRRIQAVCAHDDAFSCIRSLIGDSAIELPLGLDTELFRPGPTDVRTRLGWTPDDVVIGFVGRLALIKGVDLLATAFAEIAREVPRAKLLIVGSGEEQHRLRTVLAEAIAQGGVHLQPRMSQDQLPAWYRAMDLMVMPSRYETMSNAVLEGMACGVPFLASAVGGSKDLASTGAGWLFQSESVPALLQQLRPLVHGLGDLRVHGQRASDYAHRRYSWAASAARLEDIIRTRLGVVQ